MLSGQNGVLNRAQEAKLTNCIGSFNEQVRLAQMSVKTSITSKMSTKAGYRATEEPNFSELATDVANGLGVSAIKGHTGTTAIATEGYTVAYYLDTPGSDSKNGVGYIVIWYTDNSLRSSIKDRDEVIGKYGLKNVVPPEEEGGITSRNQATLVAVIEVENYNCSVSSEIGLTSTTQGGTDIGEENFGDTTLNNKFAFTGATTSQGGGSTPTPTVTTGIYDEETGELIIAWPGLGEEMGTGGSGTAYRLSSGLAVGIGGEDGKTIIALWDASYGLPTRFGRRRITEIVRNIVKIVLKMIIHL